MSDKIELKQALVKLGSTKPELRSHIRPLLAALQSKKAYGNDPYALEGADFAAKIWDHGTRFDLEFFYPISNAGRRGKVVNVIHFTWMWNGSTAWGWEAKDALKKAHTPQAAIQALVEIGAELKTSEPDALVQQNERDVQGVRVELPASRHIKNIEGVDIFVNLNSNPITVSSKSHSEELEEMHMTYSWKINPANKNALMAIAPLLEAARDEDAAMKIMSQNGIKYEYHSYMQGGWD